MICEPRTRKKYHQPVVHLHCVEPESVDVKLFTQPDVKDKSSCRFSSSRKAQLSDVS